MRKCVTRAEFLAEGGRACLGLGAGATLVAGCAWLPGTDAEEARPAGAPKSFVAREADVNPVHYFVKGKVKGVLVRTPKGIVGYENKCPHQGGPTTLKDKALACAWHGSTFDPATGKPLSGPARKPLPALKLAFQDGFVLLAQPS